MKMAVVIYPQDSVERESAANLALNAVGNWAETDTEVRFVLESDDKDLIDGTIAKVEEFECHNIRFCPKSDSDRKTAIDFAKKVLGGILK